MSLNKIVNGTVVTIDSFRFIYKEYNYTASYISQDKGAFNPAVIGWSVIRRVVNSPNIPPCMEVLTEKGWEGVITPNRAPAVLYPTAEEVVNQCPWEYIDC